MTMLGYRGRIEGVGMPWKKGEPRPERQNADPMVRPTEVNADLYERFKRFAIGSGVTIREAMEAAMLVCMDGAEVMSVEDEDEFAALGRIEDESTIHPDILD